MQQYHGTDDRLGGERQGQNVPGSTHRQGWNGDFGAGGSGGGTSEDLYGRTQDIPRRQQPVPAYRGRSENEWTSDLALPLAIGAGAALLGAWAIGRSWQGERHRDYRDTRFQPNRQWESRSNRSAPSRSVEIDETGDLIASSKVEGTAVYNRNGEKLGSVHNFMVGKRSGRVAYAVLSFGGLFGMGESYYPLPWNALTYDTEFGGYVVGIDKNQLSNAPSYSAGQDPFSNPGYGRRVSDYWSHLAM